MPPFDFTDFPVLTTPRLLLRKPLATDAAVIQIIRSDKQVNRYLDRPAEINAEQAAVFITRIIKGVAANQWLYWMITLKDSQEAIGSICYWNFSPDQTIIEIGYELLPDYHGQGIMQEAFGVVLEYGLTQLRPAAIMAYPRVDNQRSRRLLEKYHFEHILEAAEKRDHHEQTYQLLNTRYTSPVA
ncbi:GNAT family N-acetyltransferase [Chitinophaga nivalis]|uniref:GNAT family N-acetyltransferase n=1 Tax=Chitinophaga nivalis TaxID=2991709 RepID=A0ABT3IKU8_9BACT|nr:GNAT family N-acetyltransferase [Chitinophaga nivalis]MCW3465741.1 GNAT family N-acetyltransferase [Chitinophaga nivalis]MCW3484568.1 GNAT family N-acetyltransferase [Chitinophaga nivalis]